MKAFENTSIEYFILQKDIPGADAGTVFYWDKKDQVKGSPANGCLKLCWTPDGNCYYTKKNTAYCGDTIIFHADCRNDREWFLPYKETVQYMTMRQIEEKLGHKIIIVSE